MKSIYLDYAAATPLRSEALEAMMPFFTDEFHNPSAAYLAGRKARQELEDIRRRAAAVLGGRPAEIVFTAGATEANNLAIQGVMRQYPEAEVLVSSVEHESVLGPARLFANREIPVTEQGVVDMEQLEKMISDRTVLVSVMLVNNELGTIQPLREIASLLNKLSILRRQQDNSLPLYLHTDAAQAGNCLDLHVSRLGADLMSINGGKIYGPKQSGILYIKAGTELQPLIVGGGQEFNMRSGTENVAAAAGLVRALELASENKASESRRIFELRSMFEKGIAERLPNAKVNGAPKGRSPHIISLTLPGTDNERLMMELDERGIQCAVGSACSASHEEASHVLSAIGLSPSEARSTLRFSLGRHTSADDIEKTLQVLASLTD
ncbi:MAG TPA: cysteine desulfurase family protein [Candidatus Saccharimonadales bacterium]|nr:cysteine desulfurase family protein [Candidatus Saccharimonadales bacterium]